MRPRLLDLFCGAGGAAVGYHRAGFDVVGVDIEPQPNYPFEFEQADVLALMETWIPSCRGWWDVPPFDAIHASPPCQAYTTMANRHGRSDYALIDSVRELLEATGLPYVIENVRGALSEMRNPLELTGEQFGLGVHRPRLFESNVLLLAPPKADRQKDAAAVYGAGLKLRNGDRADGSILHAATLEDGSDAMGIDWMAWDELKEAIPPAYTEHLGLQLLQHAKVKVPA